MSDSSIVEGMPSACLLPAAKYRLRVKQTLGTILLPVRGVFPEEGPLQGEFDICPGENAFDFSEITRVMLGFNKYPSLDSDERFVIKGIQLLVDELEIVGSIIELVEENEIEAG